MNITGRLLDSFIRGIIISRGENGATISEIRADFRKIVFEEWPLESMSLDEIEEYLNNIQGLCSLELTPGGALIWFNWTEPDENNNVIEENLNENVSLELSAARVEAHNVSIAPAPLPVASMVSPPTFVPEILINKPNKDPMTFEPQTKRVGIPNSLSVPDIVQTKPNNGNIVLSPTRVAPNPPNPRAQSTNELNMCPIITQEEPNSGSGDTPSGSTSGYASRQIEFNGQSGSGSMTTPTAPLVFSDGSSNTENSSAAAFERRCQERGFLEVSSFHPPEHHDTNVAQTNNSVSDVVFYSPVTPSPSEISLNYPNSDAAIFYNWELMGDDFFLELAKVDLKCSNNRNLRRCGLCTSGQTIAVAMAKIMQSDPPPKKGQVIINLGTIDILKGQKLIDMKYQFQHLIEACYHKGIKPIITTLAPLVFEVPLEMQQTLSLFNRFLFDRYSRECPVIDLGSVFLDHKGYILVECYQNYEVLVGGKQKLVLWNRIGRQRTLKYLKSTIGQMEY